MSPETDDILRRATTGRVPRRSFLAASGLLGTGALLAACGAGSSATPAPATPAPGTASPATPAPATAAPITPAPAADVEKQLYMYNWSDLVSDETIAAFKARTGLETFQYDTYASNDELLAKLQAGASGYDLAGPTAEYVPALAASGLIQKIDWSRIPNAKAINSAFKGLPWDPKDEYQLPFDFGTTGILYRSKVVTEPLTSWQEFNDLIKGPYSGKTVFVDSMGDVFSMPLKMLGKSLNSVEKADLDQARTILMDLAPHILALDSDTYQDKLASEEAVLCLGWTGPIAAMRADPATADIRYVVPSEGTMFWMGTWVIVAGAPNPNAAYAFLDYVNDPEVAAHEATFTGFGTPNDAAKAFLDPAMVNDPAVFPPADVMAVLEGPADTSGSQQRMDIWQEFKAAIGKA